ncbi:hypothetical protein Tco_0866376 [Tanacetum coccineum]
MDVRYHFIKDHVEKGMIELYFVKTDYQLADLFTKAPPVDRFTYLVCRLGATSDPSDTICYCNMDIPESNGTQEFTDKFDELRAISGHILRASEVQIPQNNLDNLQSKREEDGTSETVDPKDCLGSLVLEVLDSTILTFLLEPTDLDAFGFLLYTLSSKDGVITDVIVVSLRGTSFNEVILVKGHLFQTIVKILPIGFDPLAPVEHFTPVECNKGLLEYLVMLESFGF